MELPASAAPETTPGTAQGVAGLCGTGSYSRHRTRSCRPSRHRELLQDPPRKVTAVAAPGATPGTAKKFACFRGTGSYSRHRNGRCRPCQQRELLPAPTGSCRPSRHRELLPALQRVLPTFAAPGNTGGTAKPNRDSAKSVAGLRGTGNIPGTAVLGVSGQQLNIRCRQSSTHLQSHLKTDVCLCCSVSSSS